MLRINNYDALFFLLQISIYYINYIHIHHFDIIYHKTLKNRFK